MLPSVDFHLFHELYVFPYVELFLHSLVFSGFNDVGAPCPPCTSFLRRDSFGPCHWVMLVGAMQSEKLCYPFILLCQLRV